MTFDAKSQERSTKLPLTGLRVLDLTLARAGPTCVRHLADWGADVIRVMPPESTRKELTDYRRGSDYQNLHRNKRALVIDLKTDEGRDALIELVRHADVLVENMRVQVKHRLKIAYEDLREWNPRLVYGSISGFGQTGPYSERAGVDQIAQGMGGLMAVTGTAAGGPTRAGIAVADMTAGNLLALAIMMALYERERTGVGRWVHTSLLESQIFMMDFQAARYLMDADVPEPVGNGHPTIVPTGSFPTSDGFVNVAPSSPKQWRGFCQALDQPDWIAKPEWKGFTDRLRARAEIDEAIAGVTRTQTTKYWVDRLEEAGIPCGPIYRMDEVFADPQVKHLGMAAKVAHPDRGETQLVGSPLNLEGIAKQLREPATIEVNTDALSFLDESK